MTGDWRPKTATTELRTQIAYDDRRIHFRFRWEQPDPGGWLHDMLVYLDGAGGASQSRRRGSQRATTTTPGSTRIG